MGLRQREVHARKTARARQKRGGGGGGTGPSAQGLDTSLRLNSTFDSSNAVRASSEAEVRRALDDAVGEEVQRRADVDEEELNQLELEFLQR